MTQLQIVNAAFDLIGESSVTSLSGTQPRVDVANRQWDFALEELLNANQWNWAKARTTLTADATAPDFGWAYRYELPSDFVEMVVLNEDELGYPGDEYELESGWLLTNAETAEIQYIWKPTTSELEAFLALMDPLSTGLLVLLLGSKMAPSLCKDGLTRQERLEARYRVKLNEAKMRDQNEQRAAVQDERFQSRSLLSRYGTGTGAGTTPSVALRGSLPHVDTKADLAALQHMTDGAVVLMLGYYTSGDGGEGIFVRDADSVATPDGGSVIASADGGNWLRVI